MKTRQYYAKGAMEPSGVRRDYLVSSVRVNESPSHHQFEVWNRGGKAGILVVNAADGPAFLNMLLPPAIREERDEAGNIIK